MEMYYNFTMSGDIIPREKKDGSIKNIDEKRNKEANVLGFTYEGTMEFTSSCSKMEIPSLQNKVVLSAKNGTYLVMTQASFENKKDVNMSFKKKNSYGENLIAEYLINMRIPFIRECSILGYNLSNYYKEIRNTLLKKDLILLKELERAIADFIIVPKDNMPTIILAINGSDHFKKYDPLWKEFKDSGLARKLNFEYIVMDTNSYKTIKNNEMAQKKLLEEIDYILGINLFYGDEKTLMQSLENYQDDLLAKMIASMLEKYNIKRVLKILGKIRYFHRSRTYKDYKEISYMNYDEMVY